MRNVQCFYTSYQITLGEEGCYGQDVMIPFPRARSQVTIPHCKYSFMTLLFSCACLNEISLRLQRTFRIQVDRFGYLAFSLNRFTRYRSVADANDKFYFCICSFYIPHICNKRAIYVQYIVTFLFTIVSLLMAFVSNISLPSVKAHENYMALLICVSLRPMWVADPRFVCQH